MTPGIRMLKRRQASRRRRRNAPLDGLAEAEAPIETWVDWAKRHVAEMIATAAIVPVYFVAIWLLKLIGAFTAFEFPDPSPMQTLGLAVVWAGLTQARNQ